MHVISMYTTDKNVPGQGVFLYKRHRDTYTDHINVNNEFTHSCPHVNSHNTYTHSSEGLPDRVLGEKPLAEAKQHLPGTDESYVES